MGQPRPGQRPVTQADYDQVKALHAQGLSRNQIAARIGRSGRTVSRIAATLGLSFDRDRTKAATEAKKADARVRRAALALALLEDAERMREQLFAPYLVYNFGGKDNVFASKTISEPDARAKRDLMMAIGTAIDKSIRLDEYDSGTGLGEVVSLLDRLGQGLAAKYGNGDAEHPPPPPPADQGSGNA